MLKNKSPDYLFIIHKDGHDALQEIQTKFLFLKLGVTFYKSSFFLCTTIEWNNLNQDLRNSESYTLFRSSILNLSGHLQIVFTTVRILRV